MTTIPPEIVNDCEKFVDFIGDEHFNVGVLDDDPDEDDPFGFFGLTFGEFGQADPQGPSKSATVGIALTDVTSEKKSGCSRRRTLEWWKAYLDSCASYHTFFSKMYLKNIKEGGGTMTGSCNAGTTRITKRGFY